MAKSSREKIFRGYQQRAVLQPRFAPHRRTPARPGARSISAPGRNACTCSGSGCPLQWSRRLFDTNGRKREREHSRKSRRRNPPGKNDTALFQSSSFFGLHLVVVSRRSAERDSLAAICQKPRVCGVFDIEGVWGDSVPPAGVGAEPHTYFPRRRWMMVFRFWATWERSCTAAEAWVMPSEVSATMRLTSARA